MLESIPNHQLADLISSIVNASFNEKLEILNAINLKDRFSKALPLLLRQIEGLKMLQEKQEQESRDVKKVKTKFGKGLFRFGSLYSHFKTFADKDPKVKTIWQKVQRR